MKELFKRHYEAIKKRGLINQDTTYHDFFEKITEEMQELSEAVYKEDLSSINQEAIDLMMVCVNLCQFIGFDIEFELCKNIETQESRCQQEK
jgi:NTP pyrophosphatase (non-canonical NTP hydrolase)